MHISAVEKAGHSTLAEGGRVSYELQAGRGGKMSRRTCEYRRKRLPLRGSTSSGFSFRVPFVQRQLREGTLNPNLDHYSRLVRCSRSSWMCTGFSFRFDQNQRGSSTSRRGWPKNIHQSSCSDRDGSGQRNDSSARNADGLRWTTDLGAFLVTISNRRLKSLR